MIDPMGNCRTIHRRILHRLACDDGAAAVSFILTFPIFMTIIAVIVQLALIVNAKIIVSHAADTAARAAMTSLPDEHPEDVRRAAWLAVTPLSPQAGTSAASEAADVASAMRQVHGDIPESFAGRYTYAMEATDVSWAPEREFARSEAAPVEVNVTYQFRLTVPFAMRMVTARDMTIAGVTGRFWEVSAQRQVQLSHGRKTRTDDGRWLR